MTLADAKERIASAPRLQSHVRPAWLESQATKGRGLWHPLYDWLEARPDHQEANLIVQTIEDALSAPIAGAVRSRGDRLRADDADYWSALSELYLAAALAKCGLSVELGNPDVTVTLGDDDLAIELTSIRRTSDTTRLTELLTAAWESPAQAVLKIPDETIRIPLRDARGIVQLMLEAGQGAATRAASGQELFGERLGNAREVDLSSVISPTRVRGFLEDGDPAYVITRSGVRTGMVDPWPDLQWRVAEKERQLAGVTCGLVAVEGGHTHSSAYIWGDRVRSGYDVPRLTAAAKIVGLLVFWMDLRQHSPWRSVFIPNSAWVGAWSEVTKRALSCLGHTPDAADP